MGEVSPRQHEKGKLPPASPNPFAATLWRNDREAALNHLLPASIGLAIVLASSPLAAHAAGQDPEVIGNWSYIETVDPMSDTRRAVAGVITDGGSFSVKCDEPGPGSVYLSYRPNEYLGRSGRGDFRAVTYRVDAYPPVTSGRTWTYTESSTLMTEDVGPLVAKLRTAERIALRAETYRGRQVDNVFELSGGDEAITRVYATCGDALPSIAG